MHMDESVVEMPLASTRSPFGNGVDLTPIDEECGSRQRGPAAL